MSLHQFAHGGDLHLGPKPRNADRRRVFSDFITAGLALPNLAAFLLPGDLNDGRMTIDDRNFLAEELTRAANRAPVCIVRGNHDLPGDLDIFGRLSTGYPIYVVLDQPHTIRIKLATGAFATVFCLPYPTEAGLVAKGVAPADIPAAAKVELEKVFLAAGAELRQARAKGDLTLAIGHINVGGSATAEGQPNIGKEIELDPTLIAHLDGCYVGLNHIHVGQEIGGAHYPGSFCRLDWAETHPKQWLKVEYLFDVPGRENPSIAVERIPIAVAPMYHVEGDLTRDGFTWQVKDGPDGQPLAPPASWAGCEVRVRARFNANERDLLDRQDWSEFRDAARFELELIAVPNRELRAPKVAAARSLGQKVEAWAEVNGAVVTDRVIEKLAGLETADPDRLATDLDARLRDLVGAEKAMVAA